MSLRFLEGMLVANDLNERASEACIAVHNMRGFVLKANLSDWQAGK